MKKINYYVFGGDGEWICYGGTPTLIGAKRLANRRDDLRDPWHRLPAIYRAKDTVEIESRGAITTPRRSTGMGKRTHCRGGLTSWQSTFLASVHRARFCARTPTE